MRIFNIVLSKLAYEQVKLDNDLERLINDKTSQTDGLVKEIDDVLEKQVILSMKIQKWQEIQNNIATIFKTFLSDTTTKQVFIILLPPSVNSEVNAYAINYNTMILEAVNDPKIKVINTMTLFEKKLDSYLRKDGISISHSGYQKLANVIIKNLE